MKQIFDLNPIEASYKLAEKDAQIKNLKNQLKQYQEASNKIKSYENQIKSFDVENKQLKNQLEQLKKQYENISSQIQRTQQSSENRKTTQKTENDLIKIFENNQNAWKNLDYESKKAKLKENSKLDGVLSYSYWGGVFDYHASYKYGFSYLSNEDGSKTCFEKSQMQTAVAFIDKLVKETNYSRSICLKILHSNLWDYEKSKNDLLY